jgi:hypothetical protein
MKDEKHLLTRKRVGDKMHVTYEEEAVIGYEAILACSALVRDQEPGPPWKEIPGYDHVFTPIDRYDFPKMAKHWDDPGWVNTERYLGYITITDSSVLREVDASEAVKERRSQLVNWYKNGWTWYRVTCSCLNITYAKSGYLGYEQADYLGRREVCLEVARRLEALGYEVVRKPE